MSTKPTDPIWWFWFHLRNGIVIAFLIMGFAWQLPSLDTTGYAPSKLVQLLLALSVIPSAHHLWRLDVAWSK